MSLHDQHEMGDYVAPKPRRRISRGRQALIGFMALGAFAATSGAGTFASFTASTDNGSAQDTAGQNPFQTSKFELLNTVLTSTGTVATGNGNGPAGAETDADCSTVDDDTITNAAGVVGADDNHAECDFLFDGSANKVIDGITTYVKIENNSATDGSGDGDLVFYAPTTCSQGTLGGASNCGQVLLYVQEIAEGAVPGAGTTTPTLTDAANEVDECVWGRASGANSSAGENDDTKCTYGRALSSLPNLASRVTIEDDFQAAKGAGNNDVRYFKVFAKLPDNTAVCGAITEPAYTGAANSGGFNASGIGCHNGYDDRSSVFELRWMLIA